MLIPISTLKKALDNRLGEGSWKDYETETLILELGLPLSTLLFDKLSVLKVIEHLPKIFFEDVLFCIYAAEVMNNSVADFTDLPHITSLEMAFAIEEMSRILSLDLHLLPEFSQGVKLYIRDILINEGYSEVLTPFDIVGVGELPKGQTEQDTQNKVKAIEDYINAIYNKSTS